MFGMCMNSELNEEINDRFRLCMWKELVDSVKIVPANLLKQVICNVAQRFCVLSVKRLMPFHVYVSLNVAWDG